MYIGIGRKMTNVQFPMTNFGRNLDCFGHWSLEIGLLQFRAF
ncbi:hypothetical protein Pr1d_09580 [Bythopirellula goksoeyrii]|uniref:Uncharacterized protein n=1 Tax=Bythopirellula goksoeyrii TaxID=1400387 RepID=A0A5B9QHU2_9BACT|nr:hypothetical protein Pr1d_09580 [Bythopirellula goksoeyrii]